MPRAPLRSLLLPGLVAALAVGCGVVPLQEENPDSGVQTGQDGGPDGGAKIIGLAVTPPTATATVGTHATFVATATFADQTSKNVTASATWTSSVGTGSGSGVATVAQGVATAIQPGTVTIAAAYEGLSGKATLTVPTATIASIVITPTSATTNVGATTTFDALADLTDGTTEDVTASATWTSSNPAVATVAAGIATGLTAGTTTLTAQVGAIVQEHPATLTVDGSPLASLAVTPANPTMAFGGTQQLTATGTYADGSTGDVTATATWASSNPAAVTVAAGGLASGVAAGTSNVSATVGSISGNTLVTVSSAPLASITVTPTATTLIVNGTVQLTATGTFGDGSTADVTTSAIWSASAVSAVVSNAQGSQGLATALAGGTSIITATVGTVSGTATVTVTATTATLQALTLTPANAQAGVGGSQPFQAEGSFSDGTQVDLTSSVTWSSTQPAVATISNAAGSNGVATAVAAGSTSIQATLSGITGTASLTVTTATLQSITVTPASPTITVGDKLAFTATGNYSDGSSANLTQQAIWASSNTTVASLSDVAGAEGLVAALAAGTTVLSASVGSISGSTTATVDAATPTSLVVSPVAPSIALGQNQTFTATLILSNNTSMDVTRMATWSSSNSSVATITNGGGMGGGPGGGGGGGPPGRATTVGAGTATITAKYMGFTGTATLTVTAAVPVSITVSPVNPTLPTGVNLPFTATAILSDGTSQNVTALATWTSSNTAVAGVSNGGGGGPGGGIGGGGGGGGVPGVVSAITAGSTVISATWQGLTGSSTVTVTSATVVSITVSPASDTLIVGDTVQYSASAIFSDGQSGDVTAAATWTSSVSAVAGVTDTAAAKGLATAIAAGSSQIQATYQGVTGSAQLTVSSATLSQILVSPTNPSVSAGTPVPFGAQALFSDGSSQDVTAKATWTSSAVAVAQVGDAAADKGVATTLTDGTATITATWDGVSGSALLTVSAATLSSIQVTPFAPTLHVGYSESFAATGLYSDNSTQDLTRLATWTSTSPATASVGDTAAQKGFVDPLASGSATIQAAYQGITGTDAVTVSAATLASIAVTPATATISVGQNQQFDALGTFSDSSTLDVTTFVTWLSSDTAAAPISNAAGSQGQATGIAAGSNVTITAVKGAVQGNANISVQ